jgi:Peptidase S46
MFQRIVFLLLMSAMVIGLASAALGDEGMYPMSELEKLDLKSAGLEIDSSLVYNPDGLSLVDGICKIGGCTGSFVSDQGLMLTNHHCAFRAIRDASSPAHDFLTEGFSAETLGDEVAAVGYTVRITDSYRDVSAQVLSVVNDDMAPGQRTKAIEKKMKELSLAEEKAHPGKRAEVSEMFLGKTYVLFLYTYLKDVRLVYSPPQAIGNFGGEQDNWMWPRHSGDFSFMRAYVGPDGEPAEYSEDNIPYAPKVVLEVGSDGVKEGDYVFIFGYPGSTYRHRSAAFLQFLSQEYMPTVVDWYGWQIENLESSAMGDRQRQLALAARVKGLQNTYKNFRGKLQGIDRLELLDTRRMQEAELQTFIDSDPKHRDHYGQVLEQLEEYYRDRTETSAFDLWLRYMLHSSETMDAALTVWENAIEKDKPEAEREWDYMARNLDQTINDLVIKADTFDPEADALIMGELLNRAADIPQAADLKSFEGLTGPDGRQAAAKFLKRAFNKSSLMDGETLLKAMKMDTEDLEKMRDPFLRLVAELYPPYLELRQENKRRKGELDQLQGALQEIKRLHLGQGFVPDANGTLRFTQGRIEGYSPRDGVVLTPFTTLEGILEKDTGEKPFNVPARFRKLVVDKEFGPFVNPELDGVPVNMLYSTDTTGGNSGSPVMNARGQVVGLNFDRAWEATINDFAWDHSYSRSIGVDIRYVLWVTWKYGGSDRLLREMKVNYQ